MIDVRYKKTETGATVHYLPECFEEDITNTTQIDQEVTPKFELEESLSEIIAKVGLTMKNFKYGKKRDEL